jgi:hypothetical protein
MGSSSPQLRRSKRIAKSKSSSMTSLSIDRHTSNKEIIRINEEARVFKLTQNLHDCTKKLSKLVQFQNNFRKCFICPVCLDFMITPMHLSCNHFVCHGCLLKLRGTSIVNCPMCRRTRATVSSIMTSCKKFIEHIGESANVIYKCPDCSVSLLTNEKSHQILHDEHISSLTEPCAMRDVQCFCKQTFSANLLHIHALDCSKCTNIIKMFAHQYIVISSQGNNCDASHNALCMFLSNFNDKSAKHHIQHILPQLSLMANTSDSEDDTLETFV